MVSSTAFDISLLVTAFLVTTVFGEMLVFATVVMPGIGKLADGDYLRAFQVIDGVVQDNQPVFVTVWIGSVVALLTSAVLAYSTTDDNDHRAGLVMALAAYLVCQVTTFTINVPLNNRVKHLEIAYLDSTTKQAERAHFEAKWCFWNWFRTFIMGAVAVYVLCVLMKD